MVLRSQVVSTVVAYLTFNRHTSHDFSTDESLHWRRYVVLDVVKAQLLRPAIGQTVAGMQIDLVSIDVEKLNGDLPKPVVTDCVLHCAEHLNRAIKVRSCNSKVEVLMLASLLSFERVDSPAAVDPDVESGRIEKSENFQHPIGCHRTTHPIEGTARCDVSHRICSLYPGTRQRVRPATLLIASATSSSGLS